MENDQHLSSAELAQLIERDLDEFIADANTEHLQHCTVCQQALESLAALPDHWDKAMCFLKEANLYGESSLSCMQSQKEISHVVDGKESKRSADSGPISRQPLPAVVLPPKHPEMLGRIGQYDIECEVGRGGMGIVFKAYDSKLHRVVAIKTLAPHLAENGTARKRFAQEAIAAAGVIHPNVIAVHGVQDDADSAYMVMPYVDGISLQSLVESQGPLAEIDIVRIGLQISAGLSAAHSQGLVHRDIKPANILVETGVNRVVITDFGLARAVDDASLTQTGWLTGTPNYMSPEQARGMRPNHRSDLFSLGSTLYFLATGRLPFRSETALGVLARIQDDSPISANQMNHAISSTLSSLIGRLHCKSPENRFQSAAELYDVLEKLLAHLHQPDVSAPPKIKTPTRNWSTPVVGERVKRGFIVGAISLATLFVLSNFLFWSGAWLMLLPSGPWTKIQVNQSGEFDRLDYSDRESDGKLLMENGTNFLLLERYDEAIELFQEATKFPDQAAQANYNIGCALALKGDREKALVALSKSIDLGFDQAKLFRTDDDLNSLRSDPRFRLLLQRLK